MSASQSDMWHGDPVPTTKVKKPSKLARVCRCTHDDRDHARGKGPCSFYAHLGAPAACTCKKFKSRARVIVEQPAHLAPPIGAIVLERDDTARSKSMGWALVTARDVTIYLAQLKTQSPNKGFFGKGMSPAVMRKMFAMQATYRDACRERTVSAIAQCGAEFVVARGKPKSIRITRVSMGSLDRHDNLRGALKYVVDGIAEALAFNDAELADSASRAGDIPIAYEQEKPGARKVCGVRIFISWSAK